MNDKRVSYNGSTSASQAGSVGSIPITRSKRYFVAVVLLLSFMGLHYFIDLNRLKPYLLKTYALKIEGPLTWTLWPVPTISAEDLHVGEILRIKHVHLAWHFLAKMAITCSEGRISGIDLKYLLAHAQQSTRSSKDIIHIIASEWKEWKKQATHPGTLFTPFDKITMTGQINQDRFETQDFMLSHAEYHFTGQGTLTCSAPYILNSNLALVYQTDPPLLLSLKGPLSNLKIRPDFSQYLQAILKPETPITPVTPEKPFAGQAFENLFEPILGHE